VARVFTPRRVDSLSDKLQATAASLVEPARAAGEFDFVSAVAEPLPVIMIADLLGIPESDRGLLRPWSAAIVRMYELGYGEAEIAAANRAAHEFMEYIGSLTADRRSRPREDLISALVQVEHEGGRLRDDELRATCIFLLNAGHEATVNGSSLGLLALLRNRAQLQALSAAARAGDVAFLRLAVDELLRYDSPLPMFERWVLEDLQFGGVQLKRGDEVALLYASGNRDERRFERADALELARADNPLLTFGLGTHYCLGAPLARLELRILYQVLFERCERLELAGEPVYSPGFVIRGLRSLPVRCS
jgi:unspecific monooxygenase